ncbi:penicillin-binding protein 1C [Spirosoma luteolum]
MELARPHPENTADRPAPSPSGWQRWWRRLRWLAAGLAVLWGFDRAFPIATQVPYATLVTGANGQILHAFLSRDDKWRFYATLADLTPAVQEAILFKEDRYFRWHPGINPVSVGRALLRNLLTRQRTSGASTITMQTVRLLEPRPRTYASKLIEVVRALQLELHYSKDEILQLYLNLIPYGSNIEGLKAAALLYFGKSPELLSLAELTTLTIIPNRPSSLRIGRNNAFLVQERNRWLLRFRAAHRVDEATLADALAEPLTAYRHEAPRLAPHLARRLQRAHPDWPIIRSTLDPAIQATAEQLVSRYASQLRAYAIRNAAVLVVDNETRAVVAYVGSADFGAIDDGGQVDGVRAVRSPGSALKPLLYGLAFDAGLITPKSKLADVPTSFDGYAPDNYDQRFNGPVTADFALANSLNIPAVALLNQLGTPVLINRLRQAGFATIRRQAGELGLSMILGGCGVTLDEMTRLYAGLADGGVVRPLHYAYPGGGPLPVLPGQRVLSADAAFLVTQTLTQVTRPDLPNNFDNSYHLPRIAWKTGTSYGRRDAWSLGYNQRYTVGVWVGNFSGVGVAELSGANTATPLLFQLMNTLAYDASNDWFRRQPPRSESRLTTRPVCPETGDIPNDFCDRTISDYAIMGVSRHQLCHHRQWILTNPAGTVAYCAYCRPDQQQPDSGLVVRRTYPNLPPAVLAYYQQQQIPVERVPPHNPACERVFGQDGPQITSLTDGSEYYIRPGAGTTLQLTCQAANDVQTVYWYMNDRLYKRASPTDAVSFAPRPGPLTVVCTDDRGRHRKLQVMIRRQ